MMKKVIFVNTLAALIFSCGPTENPEDGDVGEECVDTWWYLEQDGEIVLQGNIANLGQIPGTQYSQGYFIVDDTEQGQGCTFYSMKTLSEGVHDSLTCAIGTDQGPNPQWIGAETDSDGDHRPVITSINYEENSISGIMEGTMFRLDTFSLSPPNIEGTIVSYKFEFSALNSQKSYEICEKDECIAIKNLSEIADIYISKCRRASVRDEFPTEFLYDTLNVIRAGRSARYKTAWKLLNDNRFKKEK